MTVRFTRRSALALAATVLWPLRAAAQAQDKPLRLILPVGPGSGVDTIARAAQPALSKALGGQPIVIENLPGAGGITGTSALVKSAPDGLTIGLVSNNHVINPSVYKKMPFNALDDITPISVMGTTPMVLVVNPGKVPARTAKELVAYLKARPDTCNYASSGNGTILHLAAEMFVDAGGVQVKHIPYKGVGPMVADLIGGQVELGVLALPAAQGHLKSGALRAIGVMGAKRTPAAPELPTIAEQGLPSVDVEGWFAVVGPARLPPAEIKRIHDAFAAAFASPEVREAMARQGNDIHPSTPEAAAAYFRSELAKYAALVQKAGVTLD
ncbi:tripartite tricarboxylate transporter substrate binding protein [Ideonella sp.]|uniref:Bug family tripartite tricarboxylate transporter substrate binding protein n=1 Tax=Ideonella sp. TaxID=1929293 RepID=UPI002B465958|nr:tripartite tricarboxylate transporter substrate binding protein [Ideonella sp.]HJV69261.1 tripartite tricarboxylate transporter substrate binding protein [Ideonella sp.]